MGMMLAAQVRGSRGAPAGPTKRVLGFAQDGTKRKPERSKSRADTDRASGRYGKEGSMSLICVQGLGFFTEDSGLVYMSPQASRNQFEQR